MSYGDQLRKAREKAGLSQKTFAAKKGVSKRLVEYWEKNQKLPPRERDALTRERLLSWAQSLPASPGSSNVPGQERAR